MLNQITIMGRLTRDPEIRYTQTQIPVASFSLAVDRDFVSKESNEKQTDFIDCVAWRSNAEFVSKYFAKGSMAIVTGRLQIRDWTDKDGNKRRNAEVVADRVYFGESKRRDTDNGSFSAYPTGGNSGASTTYSASNDYSAPAASAPSVDNGFSELSDEGELPF